MNKEQTLNALAKEYLFVETLETRNRDCLDFHEVGVGNIRAALSAAYEVGLAIGMAAGVHQAAPAEPRSKLIYVEATKDTLEIFPVLQGQIEVRMREGEYIESAPVVLFIPVTLKDNVEWLYDHCSTWRLATFRKLGEELTTM